MKNIMTLENGAEVEVYESEDCSPIQRGQIRYVDFGEIDPITKEIGKCRPAVILQDDMYNRKNDATIAVVPFSKSSMYTCYTDRLVGVRIHGNNYPSVLCTNSMKFVQQNNIREYICKCPDEILDYLEEYYTTRLGFTHITEPEISSIPKIIEKLPSEILADTPLYKKYVDEADKIITSGETLNPEWVRMQSIATCKNFVALVDVLGIDYFNGTTKFNTKTMQSAVKTAKMRANSVIYPLTDIESA